MSYLSSRGRTAPPGLFTIPAAPGAPTTVTSGAINTYGSWVQMIAAAAADLFIIGVTVVRPSGNYAHVDIGVGGSGSEVSQGVAFAGVTTVWLPVAIPVAAGARIACRTAGDVGAAGYLVILHCVAAANLVGL